MLGHLLYTREYSHGARAWQGFVAILSMYGCHITANVHKMAKEGGYDWYQLLGI
jgi:hypothetical protein